MRATFANTLVVSLLIGSPAMGQPTQVFFTGCGLGWGAGAQSDLGERLDFVATVHQFEAGYPADPIANEYTLVISGLISTGSIDFGDGFYGTSFVAGSFTIRRDPSRNSLYDANPPNDSVPSSFADGAVHLTGVIRSFFLFAGPNAESRAWEASLDIQGGEVAHVFHPGHYDIRLRGSYVTEGAGLLPGYSISTSLALVLPPHTAPYPSPPAWFPDWDCASTVGVESRTWGGAKRLYRN